MRTRRGTTPDPAPAQAWAPPEPVSPQAPALRGPVLMNQDWRDLTYVHWAVAPGRVAHLMPRGVRPDVLHGRTYIGLVPFRMVDAAPGRLPGVPWAGTFLETNVRLYSVDRTGRRGVVFLSLDCDRRVVALGARAVFGVPYRDARMRHSARPSGSPTPPVAVEHTYRSRLRNGSAATLVRVEVGEPREPTELDHFVSARWGLHTRRLGRTWYIPNQHAPWPLHDARVTALEGGALGSVGLGELADRTPDHVAFSPGVHTEFGLPRPASRARR